VIGSGQHGYRKSSYSGAANPNCVEVAFIGDHVAVRDSKDRSSDAVLYFTHAEWEAFLAGAHAGDFDFA
jgi:hypothetical protein